jgi:3',5'-nucleoside bisphosphate phosphatase
LIDLHTHTTESDGTYMPEELVQAAVDLGLEALAITDHDTLSGYKFAKPNAEAAGLRLVCGIEVSTKLEKPRRTVHLLGYFPKAEPTDSFHDWLAQMQASRRDRNIRLAERLRTLGLDITIEEVENIGRSLAGRPHFARLMVEKGYVQSIQEAFHLYLDESAPGYVDRDEPTVAEGIRRINDAGGISSVAHPIRLGKRDHGEEEELIRTMIDSGLLAIEAYHSDHSRQDTERYLGIARKYGLKVTGGSDFHGGNKPNIELGRGFRQNLNIGRELLESLEA